MVVGGDGRIRDDDVEMGDIFLEDGGQIDCVLFVLGVVFRDDEVAIGALRKTRKGFGGLDGRVAHCGDDGDGGAGEEVAEEGSAETSEGFSMTVRLAWVGGVERARNGFITPVGASNEVYCVCHGGWA